MSILGPRGLERTRLVFLTIKNKTLPGGVESQALYERWGSILVIARMDTAQYGETLKICVYKVPTDLIIPVYVSQGVSPYFGVSILAITTAVYYSLRLAYYFSLESLQSASEKCRPD